MLEILKAVYETWRKEQDGGVESGDSSATEDSPVMVAAQGFDARTVAQESVMVAAMRALCEGNYGEVVRELFPKEGFAWAQLIQDVWNCFREKGSEWEELEPLRAGLREVCQVLETENPAVYKVFEGFVQGKITPPPNPVSWRWAVCVVATAAVGLWAGSYVCALLFVGSLAMFFKYYSDRIEAYREYEATLPLVEWWNRPVEKPV